MTPASAGDSPFERGALDAVLFDLDGVLTDTAPLHAACWKRLFDGFLRRHPGAAPFDRDVDYRAHLDGKPRLDGVRDFLRSRGIELPPGDDRSTDDTTLHGLGAQKNAMVRAAIDRGDVALHDGAAEVVADLRERGFATGVVSSSRNCAAILDVVGIAALFDVCVDGTVAASRGLPGKPDPATYREAARTLGVEPARAAVVEDAVVGVQAGRAGGFGLVIGVGAGAAARSLLDHGADLVVPGLAALLPAAR